jgi:RNA polymerase sigma-70 factor (ECF subfamily)
VLKAVQAAPIEPVASPNPPDFEALYRAHFDFVWRILRRLGVRTAALDDAAQEVFLVVHRRLAEFQPDTSARAWLFAIAQRVASDQRRWVRRKGQKSVALEDDLHSQLRSPFEATVSREASDLVLDFLAEIDADRRDAFVLSELEQMSAPEIARAVDANVSTVYTRIASSRRAFAAFIARRCPDTGGEPT